jgi:hypothetical protein
VIHHEPRVILYDLETSHNLAAVFSLLHNDYIQPENIIRERYIICFSYKELGEKQIHAVSILDDPKRFKHDPYDDTYVVTKLHEVLFGADVLVAHNGDNFDLKYAKTRMLVRGLPPLPPIPAIDTLKVAREQFLFNANRLDYLGNLLKVGRKKPTTTGLWLRILQGDAAAIREMVTYNKQDVALLERVFLKLQPYMSSHIHRQLFGGDGTCPRCGSNHVQMRGIHRATTNTYQRYQCQTCLGWFREKKANKQMIHTRIL